MFSSVDEIWHLTQCENEIMRLTQLQEKTKEHCRLVNSLKTLKLHTSQTDKRIDFHNSKYNLLTAKIQFWEGLKRKELPLSLKNKINELTDDWLSKSWDYFGQEDIKKDSKDACDEIAFVNEMFKRCNVIDDTPPKKKTRRGGKKKARVETTNI